MNTSGGLGHPLLDACGVPHAFGTRALREPPELVRPRQVHGAEVWILGAGASAAAIPGEPVEADAVVSTLPDVPVGVVTADCVPLLLASQRGCSVAAVHAGWRGLARGIIPTAVAILRERAGLDASLVAVIGPHIGPCCYEIDGPVVEALRPRFGAGLGAALSATRPGHHRLDLGLLAQQAAGQAGIEGDSCGALSPACTRCDSGRFHSYRRDGARAGRLIHFVAARPEG